MGWNWQHPEWPRLVWDSGKTARAEQIFAQQAGLLVGSVHLQQCTDCGN
jgi:hypothetical protein